jgi:hypothetical protein
MLIKCPSSDSKEAVQETYPIHSLTYFLDHVLVCLVYEKEQFIFIFKIKINRSFSYTRHTKIQCLYNIQTFSSDLDNRI